MLSASGALAVLLPCASIRHGHHAPARTLIEAGVPVALGTNFNPWHTPTLNMQTAISLACLQLSMSPAEAITAATINAAHALNAADRQAEQLLGRLIPARPALDATGVLTEAFRRAAAARQSARRSR